MFIRSVHTDSWTTIFWRSVSAAATMFLFLAIRKRAAVFSRFRSVGWPGVLLGLCFCGASTCYIPAVMLTSVANTLILMSTGPYVAGLLGFILLGERVAPRTWLTMGVVLVGAVVMVSDSYRRGAIVGGYIVLTAVTVYTALDLRRVQPA